jgi:hypothetical protein
MVPSHLVPQFQQMSKPSSIFSWQFGQVHMESLSRTQEGVPSLEALAAERHRQPLTLQNIRS